MLGYLQNFQLLYLLYYFCYNIVYEYKVEAGHRLGGFIFYVGVFGVFYGTDVQF